MLQSARKYVAVTVPRLPGKVLFSVSAVTSFVWLLTQDLVHPLAVYLLQLYLAF